MISNTIKSVFFIALTFAAFTSQAQQRSDQVFRSKIAPAAISNNGFTNFPGASAQAQTNRAYSQPPRNNYPEQQINRRGRYYEPRDNYNERTYRNNSFPETQRYYYNGGYHTNPSYYSPYTSPVYGSRVNVLPGSYYQFNYGSRNYYYNDGAFYRPYNGFYETIEPPYGAYVPMLPFGARAVLINGRTYYEYNGTYYQQQFDRANRGYMIAGNNGILREDEFRSDSNDIISDESVRSRSQNEYTFAELPSNFRKVIIDNKISYVSPSGDFYEKTTDENGLVTYKKHS